MNEKITKLWQLTTETASWRIQSIWKNSFPEISLQYVLKKTVLGTSTPRDEEKAPHLGGEEISTKMKRLGKTKHMSQPRLYMPHPPRELAVNIRAKEMLPIQWEWDLQGTFVSWFVHATRRPQASVWNRPPKIKLRINHQSGDHKISFEK